VSSFRVAYVTISAPTPPHPWLFHRPGTHGASVVEECTRRPQAFSGLLSMLKEADPILSPCALALLRAMALVKCVCSALWGGGVLVVGEGWCGGGPHSVGRCCGYVDVESVGTWLCVGARTPTHVVWVFVARWVRLCV
jgi:hypothetical protein